MMEKPFFINPLPRYTRLDLQHRERSGKFQDNEENSLIVESNTIYEVDLTCIKNKKNNKK